MSTRKDQAQIAADRAAWEAKMEASHQNADTQAMTLSWFQETDPDELHEREARECWYARLGQYDLTVQAKTWESGARLRIHDTANNWPVPLEDDSPHGVWLDSVEEAKLAGDATVFEIYQ